jgi:DNA-binding NarL/FixJ family response regulator
MKILVIEDQTMMRDFLAAACVSGFAYGKIGQASDGASALAACAKLIPDLMLLDLALPDCDGLDLLPRLRELAPQSKVIVLSAHTDEVTLHRALKANVNGFIDKYSHPAVVLREAIETVMSGRQYLTQRVQQARAAIWADTSAATKIFTDREQDVLHFIGEGLSNGEIAAKLSVSEFTVSNHRCNIMNKLGIHSTPRLIHYAIEKGFTRLHAAY